MSRADIILHMLRAADDEPRVTTFNAWVAAALRYRMVGEVTLRFSSVEEAQQFAACVARHRAEAG